MPRGLDPPAHGPALYRASAQRNSCLEWKPLERLHSICHHARVATWTFDHRLRPGDPQLIAELHRHWVAVAGYDVHSIDSPLPTADQVVEGLAAADAVVVARQGELIRGYGRLLSWAETDGTRVHLLDTHSAPGHSRAAIEEALFINLEEEVGQDDAHPMVLGANAELDDLDRTAVLEKLGYELYFEMVELELGVRHNRGPVPPGVVIRPAQPADAASVAHLIEEVWAGRPYFGGLTVERTALWLEKTDPELFLLAEAARQLIGLAAAKINERVVEIDDLGVLPTWRRHGLATGLMTELLDRIGNRTALPVRLLTEAHDPSGARALYERLGFTTAARHGRYRKPLT